MDKSLNNFVNNIKEINDIVKILLEDDGIVKEPYTGEETKRYIKKIKYEVIDVGEAYDEVKNPSGKKNNPPNENYVEIDIARQYDPNVEIGDEIEIESVDFEDMTAEEIAEWATEQNLDKETLEQIIVAGPKTVRIGGKVLRLGPKGYRAAKRGIKSALTLKKFLDRYGKKIDHSRCWCLGVVKDFIDPVSEEPSETMFKDHISEFIKPVEEELLEKWRFCNKKYGKYFKKKDDRQKTTEECITIDDMWLDQKSNFDSLVSLLSNAFKVTGINIKKEKTPGRSGESSVAEKIVSHDYVFITFTADVEKEPDAGGTTKVTIFNSGTEVKFRIVGTHKDQNNTVLLETSGDHGSGGDKYKEFVMSFDTAGVKRQQSNNLILFVKSDGSLSNKKSTWSGKIEYYKDN